MAQRFDQKSCTACAQNWGAKQKQAPCMDAKRIAEKNHRPQVRGFAAAEIGIGCPFTRSWPELYAAITRRGGYDANEYGKSTIDTILNHVNRGTVPANMKPRADVGAEARYILDSASGRWGYNGNYGFRPILLYDPSNADLVRFAKNTFANDFVVDDATTWIGFVGRTDSGAGVGDGRAKGGGYFKGRIWRARDLNDKGFNNSYKVEGLIDRVFTVGVDAVTGLNLIIVTGMNRIEQLKEAKFSGEDINIALVANFKAVTNLSKLPKWAKIAEKVVFTSKSLENWEKMELIGAAQRCSSLGNGWVTRNQAEVNLIDLGVSSGAAISFTKWKGRITSVTN